MERIINVLELLNGIPSQIESFPIYEEQLSEEVVKQAEKYFLDLVKEHNQSIDGSLEFDEDWEEDILDNAYYSDDNGYEVYIIWSN
jgi:hypothetical protein